MCQLVVVFEICREGMFDNFWLVLTFSFFFQDIALLGAGRNHLSKKSFPIFSALGGENFSGLRDTAFPICVTPYVGCRWPDGVTWSQHSAVTRDFLLIVWMSFLQTQLQLFLFKFKHDTGKLLSMLRCVKCIILLLTASDTWVVIWSKLRLT